MPTELWIAAAAVYLVMSLITFVMFWRDKRAAQKGNWRTPEKTLLGLSFLGGWPGAILAMKLVRHKTKHASFKLGVPLMGALHILAWLAVGYFTIKDTLS